MTVDFDSAAVDSKFITTTKERFSEILKSMAQDYLPEGLAADEEFREAMEEVMAFDVAIAYHSSLDDSDSGSDVESSHASVCEETYIDACLDEAFSEENLKRDLLRCPYWPPPDPKYVDDRIHYLVQEFALVIRFGRLQVYWTKMSLLNWITEIKVILEAINNPDNIMILWDFMDKIFIGIEDALKNEDTLDVSARKQVRMNTTSIVAKTMTAVVALKNRKIEEELKNLLPTMVISVKQAKKFVQDAVREDCEMRGPLALATIPGFLEILRLKCSDLE